MKTSSLLVLGAVVVLAIGSGCRSGRAQGGSRTGGQVQQRTATTRTSLPPGHAKKVAGHQSARAFAPGQQKKGIVVKNKTVIKKKPAAKKQTAKKSPAGSKTQPKKKG